MNCVLQGDILVSYCAHVSPISEVILDQSWNWNDHLTLLKEKGGWFWTPYGDPQERAASECLAMGHIAAALRDFCMIFIFMKK